MKLTRARKYEKILRKTRGIFYKNPLLSLGLALPLAVIPSYNLIATTAVSLSMLICFVPAVLLASLIGKRIASPWQVVVYPLVSCLLLIPTRILLVTLFPMIQDTLGIYLSLVCVNSLLMYATGKASEQKPGQALGFALRLVAGRVSGRLCLRSNPRAVRHRQPVWLHHFIGCAAAPCRADGHGRLYPAGLLRRFLPHHPPPHPDARNESGHPQRR